MHDETLDRTTNAKGRICDCIYDDLPEKIPTLYEALDHSIEKFEKIYIEFKDLPELAVLDLDKYIDSGTELVFHSFDKEILTRLNILYPGIPLSFVTFGQDLNTISEMKNIKELSINHKWILNNEPEVIKELHSDYTITSWVVKSNSTLKALSDMGINNIITDRVL